MSDSENEYETIRQANLARKKALLAELGVVDLCNEGKKLVSQFQSERKERVRARKKTLSDVPSRRSRRIQKRKKEVKYVTGFRGFESSESLQSSNAASQPVGEHCSSEEYSSSNSVKNKKSPKEQNSVLASNCTYVKGKENLSNKFNVSLDEWQFLKSCKENVLVFEKGKCIDNTCNDLLSKSNEAKVLVPYHSISGRDDQINAVLKLEKTIDDSFSGNEVLSDLNLTESNDYNKTQGNHYKPNLTKYSPLSDSKNDVLSDADHVPWHEQSVQACLTVIKKSLQENVKFECNRLKDSDSEDDWSQYKEVMFCVSTSNESDDDIEESSTPRARKVGSSRYSFKVPELSSEDVTEDLIANIAKYSSRKVYDQVNGTTCHQCRQKTIDTKTVCRSGRCVGVRGMFCGICLLKRYGENVADALRNPSWVCPVCREECNCSFCRSRAGKIPTGILYPEAKQLGYKSVAEYLKENESENEVEKSSKLKVMATL